MGRGQRSPPTHFFYESDLNFFSSMNLDIKINFKGTALGFVFVKKKQQCNLLLCRKLVDGRDRGCVFWG
jgi:hypothetical protein